MGKNFKHHPSILIVEDDPAIRDLMALVIESEDHWKPTKVHCGEHAVEAWDKAEFDVILMDLRLSGIDGIETTKRIREQERRSGLKPTPVIAFSAIPEENTFKECAYAGIDDFIYKPFRIQDVIDTIYKHL